MTFRGPTALRFLIFCGLAATAAIHAQPAGSNMSAPRYFAFVSYAGTPKIEANEFIIQIDDPALAEQYAQMVRNNTLQPRIAFTGTVVPGRAPYNEAWAFHVDPASVQLGGASHIEVCDSAPEYVEEHLQEVGGSFLPGAEWCPWSMHVSREVLR